MTFNKMLKQMVENPKAKFGSQKASALEQNLSSILFWLNDYSKEKGLRAKSNVYRMIDSTDWVQEVSNVKNR